MRRAPVPGVTPIAPQEDWNKSRESGNERASRQSDPLAGKALSVIAFVAEGSAQNSHLAPFSSTRPRVLPAENQLLCVALCFFSQRASAVHTVQTTIDFSNYRLLLMKLFLEKMFSVLLLIGQSTV